MRKGGKGREREVREEGRRGGREEGRCTSISHAHEALYRII